MLLISCLLLLSLLTKETGVVFILLILLYRIIFHRHQWVSFFSLFLSSVIAVIPYVYLRNVIAQIHVLGGPSENISIAPISMRLLNIPAIFFYYIKNFFYPSHLAFEQDWIVTTIDFPHFYFPLIIDLLFFISIFLLGWFVIKVNRKEFPIYLFFLAWLTAGLTIYSQIIPLDLIVADRWMYLPLVGLVGIIGVGAHSVYLITKEVGEYNAVWLTLGFIVISSLSIRTAVRNTDWSSEIGILSHDLPYYNNIASQEGVFGEMK